MIRILTIAVLLLGLGRVSAQQPIYLRVVDVSTAAQRDAYIQTLTQSGYHCLVLNSPFGDGKQRILIGPFASAAEREAAAQRLTAAGYQLSDRTDGSAAPAAPSADLEAEALAHLGGTTHPGAQATGADLEAQANAALVTNAAEAERRRQQDELDAQAAAAQEAADAAQEAADAQAAPDPPKESTALSILNAVNGGLQQMSDTLAQQNARQAAQNEARMQQAQAQVDANDARRAQQAEAAREAAAQQAAAREAQYHPTTTTGIPAGCNNNGQACRATGNPPSGGAVNQSTASISVSPPPSQPSPSTPTIVAAPQVPSATPCVAEGSSIAPGTTARCSPSVCRETNLMVHMDARWADLKHTNHEVVGWLTNDNGVTDATCVWAFHRNGQWGDGGEAIIPAGAKHQGGEGGGIWTMGADSSDIKYDCFEGRNPVDIHGNSCTAAVKFTGFPAAGTQ